MLGQFFAGTSLFVGAVVLFAAMVGAREIGAFAHRIADRRHGSVHATEGDANVLLSVALGLLSLLIGFAFSLAVSRYDHRRELVASEARAITTAAQRLALLDAPVRHQLANQLRAYVAVRVAAGESVKAEARNALDRRSTFLSHQLVESTIAAVLPFRGSSTATFVLDGMDHALDLADQRREAENATLPIKVIETLAAYCVVVAGLFGYALTSTASRNRVASYLLFALFASVIAMILDLDRPRGGAIMIGQQPMAQVLQNMAQ